MNSKIVGGLPAMRLRYSSLFICIVGIVPLLICTSLVQTVHAEANANTNAKASSVHEADRYRTRDFTTLSGDGIRRIAEAYPPEYESVTDGHLGKLLIPRASGSENNTLVQNYISSMFTNLGWYEEKTPFTGSTPIGEVEFTNLIYTFDPDAPRKIILSAHFDSKWFPDYPANQFIGATDSAAPCALLLSLAEFITPLLSSRRDRLQALQGILRDGYDEEELSETTLQLVFFDGEEAFHDWTATDSIYGARHLAETWSETYLPSSHPLARRRQSPLPSVLNTIDVLVLLDLLGNSHSSLHSYFRETDWLFDEMKSADQRLRDMGLVEVERGQEGWFSPVKMRRGMIGDDHIPFLHRGVSILHVISSPFPNVWHTLGAQRLCPTRPRRAINAVYDSVCM
ncbi:glutaminyl cyclase [Kwoniella heveanensis BCC8398]|uniref:Peptide hydrolase n=1 Tax=Kwoniella heveanensis BCC8398 TaxID=1296120 RepID=A0A1B9GUL2_9TREE|nr:glutaminyl cyclase [Kwoniella heveanensis BCC8398]